MNRYLRNHILQSLDAKIVLLSGPRQVGKTVLSKSLGFSEIEYFNYDLREDRKRLRDKSWLRSSELVILDELHKMKEWKSWLKGIYDVEGIPPRLLVTGSARLEVFRLGGESLAGRYFPYRLHPISVKEACNFMSPENALERICKLGGFPEPFLSGTEEDANRWRRTHVEAIIREDLQDIDRVHDLRQVQLLVELLSERVGSCTSRESLSRDLKVSPNTIKRWIEILESLYIIFTLTPWKKNINRSIRKQPKIYFFDTGYVRGKESHRYENAIACALLKHCHFLEDIKGEKRSLHYVKNRNGKEVDFCIVKDSSIELLLEAKLRSTDISQLNYFKKATTPQTELVLLVNELNRESDREDIKIRKTAKWLATLAA